MNLLNKIKTLDCKNCSHEKLVYTNWSTVNDNENINNNFKKISLRN